MVGLLAECLVGMKVAMKAVKKAASLVDWMAGLMVLMLVEW